MSEERLRAVTVGGLKPLDATVTLETYNPGWPALYMTLARQIRDALGAGALRLEHVGSTSVPGLAAKPVIDMVLAVADSADEGAYVPPLERAGFVLAIREPDWFEHRMFRAPGIAGNLHVFSQGCSEIGRMLAFRDRLRADDADRALYTRVKRALAERTWRYMQDYADAKSAVVAEIMARAAAE